MRSTLGFPTRGSKSNTTCVSTHSIWLCYFRNFVQSQQKYGPTMTTPIIPCVPSQRYFSSRSLPSLSSSSTSTTLTAKTVKKRLPLHLLLLADLDQHMSYLIRPLFTHRHFRVRSKPLLATHSATASLPSKDMTSNRDFDTTPQHDSSLPALPVNDSPATHITGTTTTTVTKKLQQRHVTMQHPRWFNKTNDIDLQLEQLKGNAGHLSPSFIFKTLRSMLYNTTQYNCKAAWKIYQAMIEHQVSDYMRTNHYGHLLNMIKYAPKATPMLLTILNHMKAAQDEGRLVIEGRHYSQIMYGMSRQGDVAAICDLLQALSWASRGDPVSVLQPSWYTSLATAAKKYDDLAFSIKAAGLMEYAMKEGIVMEKEACAVMISALSMDMESTAKFLTTMKDAGMMTMGDVDGSIRSNNKNDKYTQNDADKKAALEISAAESAKYNVHIYTSLISGLAQNGDAINARQLWKDMRNNGLRPTTATYAAMIEAYGQAGNFNAAISLLKKYTYGNKRQLNMVMATSLLTNALRHGKLDMAKSLLCTWMDTMALDMDKMDTKFRSTVLLVKVMDDMDVAQDYFESLYNRNPGYVDSIMVNHLVHGYGNAKEKQKVLDSFKLHDRIPSPLSSSSWTNQVWPHAFLVDALFKCQDVPAALSALIVMRQYSVPDEIVLAMVIRGLVMNDEDGVAWSLFQTMKSTGVEPNLHSYTSIMKACIKGARHGATTQKKQQKQQQKQPIPNELIEAALNIKHYNNSSQIKLGPHQAYILFRKMTGFQKPNVYTYTTLIACFAKHNLNRAMDVFIHMRAEGVEPVLETYVALLQGCAIFRNGPMALKFFRYFQEQSNLTPNGKIWHYLFKALGRSRTSRSEIDKLAAHVRATNKGLPSGR